jgi:4-amino-4-deoxy-L-arabinose transferase-like glycosyltransferase
MIRPLVSTGQRLRPVLDLFLWSRAAIWGAVLFAFLVFEPNRHPRADRWDVPRLTNDTGYVVDVWARWDSVWFLRLAHDGYGGTEQAAAAFYPLYPILVGLLGRLLFGHYVLAGVLISLAAALGCFLLLYQLAERRLGAAGARRAVLYLALFPFALFLQAVYSESLFLLLVMASFLLAERGNFLGAGLTAGLAWLTKPLGVALLPPLALIAWRSTNRGGALLRLAAAPALFAVYPLWLWWRFGDPLEFVHAEEDWGREVSRLGPLGGLWEGLRAGWAGVRQLASGSHTERFWSPVQDTDPMRVAVINLENLAFLVLFAALTVVVWRRFGAPYGLFLTLSLAIPLSVPSERWPLVSMPRFGLALFPIFLALAAIGERPRVNTAILAISAVLLGICCVQWALWQWVA